MNGWIKIHRKILDWGWYDDTNTTRLFLHLLLIANHKSNTWHGVEIGIGQAVIGLYSLSKTLGISVQSLRTSLTKLKSTNEITIKSTNKFSVITILKYSDYQINENNQQTKQQSNQQTTNKQLTNNQQHLKNIRNKEIKNTIQATPEEHKDIIQIMDIFKGINPTINYGNKTTRNACIELIKKFGLDGAKKFATYAVSIQGKNYAPTITTPYQLKEKLAQLKIYADKSKQSKIQSL